MISYDEFLEETERDEFEKVLVDLGLCKKCRWASHVFQVPKHSAMYNWSPCITSNDYTRTKRKGEQNNLSYDIKAVWNTIKWGRGEGEEGLYLDIK